MVIEYLTHSVMRVLIGAGRREMDTAAVMYCAFLSTRQLSILPIQVHYTHPLSFHHKQNKSIWYLEYTISRVLNWCILCQKKNCGRFCGWKRIYILKENCIFPSRCFTSHESGNKDKSPVQTQPAAPFLESQAVVGLLLYQGLVLFIRCNLYYSVGSKCVGVGFLPSHPRFVQHCHPWWP